MFTAADCRISEREMMGARLAGNAHSARFRLADKFHRFRAAYVLAVDVRSGQLS